MRAFDRLPMAPEGPQVCAECDDVAEVRLALTPLCVACWRSITNPWRERHDVPLTGRGRVVGAPRFDGWAVLRCVDCRYSWIGPPGERCHECPRLADQRRVWQAELTLRPPDVELDDKHRGARLEAWAERLGRAVESGLITEAQARHAIEREGVRHVAA